MTMPTIFRGKFVIQPGEVYEIDGANYEIITAVVGILGGNGGNITLGSLTYVLENTATGERSHIAERELQAKFKEANRMTIEAKPLKVGATVRNKFSGELGVIKYSTFGVKVAGRNSEGKRWKTNGYAPEYLAEYWEVVDSE